MDTSDGITLFRDDEKVYAADFSQGRFKFCDNAMYEIPPNCRAEV